MASALLTPGLSRSATVTHTAFAGTLQTINDIAGYTATGEDMAGMLVTAYFDSALSISETVAWNAGAPGTGSAVGTNWRVDEAGDTFDSTWRLTASPGAQPIYGVRFEGFAQSSQTVRSGTVFDRTDPSLGTDGSAQGRDLEEFAMAGNWDTVKTSYIDEVTSLAHTPPPGSPVRDLYRELLMQFGDSVDVGGQFPLFQPDPFRVGDEWIYFQDTDLVGSRIPNGNLTPEGVPEPSTVLLLAVGLTVAMGSRVCRRGT